MPKDWEDAAVERQSDEVLERSAPRISVRIRQIDAALRRIDDGTYGICKKCGEDDATQARLEALPAHGRSARVLRLGRAGRRHVPLRRSRREPTAAAPPEDHPPVLSGVIRFRTAFGCGAGLREEQPYGKTRSPGGTHSALTANRSCPQLMPKSYQHDIPNKISANRPILL